MTVLSSNRNIQSPLNSLTVSGIPNPDGHPATATITVIRANVIGNGHNITLTDGYGVSYVFTFVTGDNDCTGRDIGVQTAIGTNSNNLAASQIALSINTENSANGTPITATASEEVVTVTSSITWSNNLGNETNSSSDGSGGNSSGFAVTNFNFGREARTSLKLNHTELLGIGESSFIQETKEGILKARTGMSTSATPLAFRIPESWDLEWNYRLGPIWTPDSTTGTDDIIKCWLKSHIYDFPLVSSRQIVQTLIDQSTEGNDYLQTTSKYPFVADPDPARNNFRSIKFDGTNDCLFCADSVYGDDFNVSATGDFGIFFVITTSSDQDNTQCLLQIGRDSVNGTFNLSIDTTSTNKTITVHTKDGGTDFNKSFTTAIDHSTSHVIFVGRVSGADTVRVDGTTLSGSADAIKEIDAKNRDSTLGCAFGVGGGTNESNYFFGNLFEFLVVLEGSGDFSNAYKKYEGYLAWKYNTVATLASDHDYKLEPPRASICL